MQAVMQKKKKTVTLHLRGFKIIIKYSCIYTSDLTKSNGVIPVDTQLDPSGQREPFAKWLLNFFDMTPFFF